MGDLHGSAIYVKVSVTHYLLQLILLFVLVLQRATNVFQIFLAKLVILFPAKDSSLRSSMEL